ncbi:MAG: alpha/beta fold hydrolase [Verrucomicrobia bacterium]|nr:alpha/beta fold hydrolase [Verrucomicrobiota bacterium]
MLRLAFLHGFLRNKDDWAEVIRFLPEFSCLALDYPFAPPQDAIVVGYSMGGRIALSLPQPKIIISAHVGLRSGHAERRAEEDAWMEKLQTLPYSSFLDQWYDQPVFETLRVHPIFADYKKRCQNSEVALQQLSHHRISEQPLLLPGNAYYIHGEKDKKYADLYNQFSLNSIAIPRSGHVCPIENPEECARAIRIHVDSIQNLHRHHLS